MSTEQPTLREFGNATEDTEAKQDESARVFDEYDDAVYGRARETAQQYKPEDEGCCRRCGEPVSNQAQDDATVRRVFGDEYDRVPACPACPDMDAGTVSKAVLEAPKTSQRARVMDPTTAWKREGGEL